MQVFIEVLSTVLTLRGPRRDHAAAVAAGDRSVLSISFESVSTLSLNLTPILGLKFVCLAFSDLALD